ncbi:MAG: right-handed parallel beta-helix repeat-containing protein [Candidatus Poribacteria bacterium]
MENISAKIFLTMFALLFCILNFVSIIEAVTLHVPSDYDTIQAAIDDAFDGDEIIVADGIYIGDGNKNLDFYGKAIKVRSENGPHNCIIDCENNGRGFYFHSGEDSSSVVKGFTIRNGYVSGEWPNDSGGGISCISSSPTITDNIITNNSAVYGGGGIFCVDSSSPIIQDNTITLNTAFLGGGIYCFSSSSPTIQNNLITANSADISHGGGGGGISCSESSPTIVSNIITQNSAGVGGGIDVYHYASPTIVNNVITFNAAHSPGWGGGIFCYDVSSVDITNNTVVGNSASFGSGIFCGHFAEATVVNTILWNLRGEVFINASSITITYSDVQGGYEGEGNIDALPMFFRPRQNYHLRPASPCIGAGTNIGAPSFDKDGNPRPNPPGSNCDIGAYESRFAQPRGTD